MKKKKRNPNDLTGRNLNALKKLIKESEKRILKKIDSKVDSFFTLLIKGQK